MKEVTKKVYWILCIGLCIGLTTVTAFSIVHARDGIRLPKTGQTTCYTVNGTVTACPGTGQDGETQAGIAWPNPRFAITYCHESGPCADQNSDCDSNASTDVVTDNLTGLMWARSGNFTRNDYNPWGQALEEIASFNRNGGLCAYTDWRLPNVNELESLIHAEKPNTAEWLNSQGFVDVQPDFYWSSTIHAQYGVPAWVVSMVDGTASYGLNTNYRFIWQVRSGQRDNPDVRYPANLWKTGQTKNLAEGDDGDFKTGVKWPIPRFKDHGDGTVTDNLTGLMWAKDANAPGPAPCKPGTPKRWQEALDYAACLNTNHYLGFDDWRLPDRKELFSLIDRSKYGPALPAGHPFLNLQFQFSYYSSTTTANYKNAVWTIYLMDGTLNLDYKPYMRPVWPLRGETGPDLTGSWISLSQTCKGPIQSQKCTITGSIEIVNSGGRDAPSSNLKFYLSKDGILHGDETLLKQSAAGRLKPGEKRIKQFSYRLPSKEKASGQYIIAAIDANHTVSETDESNNLIVFGPIP
jgi:hypothetical protein